MKNDYNSVNEYINSSPEEVQPILEKIRGIVIRNAPKAEESISYGMPAYKQNGKPLIYFAAFKNHIGLYATPDGHTEFEMELSKYKRGKGSVQFPLTGAMPFDLIERIVEFRVNQTNVMSENKQVK